MSSSKKFLLDANVFIEAHKKYYAFDICSGFWKALERQYRLGTLASIDRIKLELTQGRKKDEEPDALSDWANKSAPVGFFKGTTDIAVIKTFGDMAKWVQGSQQFKDPAKQKFADVADGWLIAYAKENGLIVVTHEQYAPEVQNKVPIPNVCIEFGVEFTDTFDMLRELKEEFVLKTKRRKS